MNVFTKIIDSQIVQIKEIAQGGIIIPVPIDNKTLRKRTFNQSELICRQIKAKLNIDFDSNILKKAVKNKQQSRLKRETRFENVRGTFKVINSKKILNKEILLVDDIFTTGATLNACSEELRKCGAAKVRCLTIARAI